LVAQFSTGRSEAVHPAQKPAGMNLKVLGEYVGTSVAMIEKS
jgi:hypothetical protein